MGKRMILPIPSRRSNRIHKNVKTGGRVDLPIRSYPRAKFQRGIFALPPELIFKIFSYISDPCQACFLTCSVFYQKFRYILQNHKFQRPKGEEYAQRGLHDVRSLLQYSGRRSCHFSPIFYLYVCVFISCLASVESWCPLVLN